VGRASGTAELVHARAEHYLARTARAFELVFLDPPFAGHALDAVAARLQAGGWLAPGCLVYLEHPRKPELPPLPADLQPLRRGAAGAVGYDLYEYR
jgi:16S rRNA (guanine966-N2)-methyltransferase